MLLVNVSKFNGLAHLKLATIGLFKSHDETEKRSLASTVRTDNTHDAVRRKHEVEVVEKHLLTESLLHALSLNYLVAKSRSVRDEYLKFLFTLLLLLVEHLLVRVKTRLTLCLTCLWCHAHPFKFALQSLATLRCRLLLLFHALCLLVKP